MLVNLFILLIIFLIFFFIGGVILLINYIFNKKGYKILKGVKEKTGLKLERKKLIGVYKDHQIELEFSLFNYFKFKISKIKNEYDFEMSKAVLDYYNFPYYPTYENITYDSKFDNNFKVPDKYKKKSAAYLSNEIRSILIKYYTSQNSSSGFFKVSNNYLKANVSAFSVENLFEHLEKLIKISNRFTDKREYELLLIENLKDNESRLIRFNYLKSLLLSKNTDKYKNHIKKFLDDEDPLIVYHTAVYFKEEGVNKLIELLNCNENDIVINALQKLKKYINEDITNILMKKIYNFANEDILAEFIDYFILSKYTEKSFYNKFIIKYKSVIDISDSLKLMLIKYIRLKKEKAGFLFLISMLDKKYELIYNSILALKELNDIAAVEYLLPIQKKARTNDLRLIASEVIHHLQQNVKTNEHGILTIINNESGNLSIDENEEKGNLSLE